MTIHHIGYLVKKLDRARLAFEALGYGVEQETIRDEFRKVDIVFLSKDDYRIELVSPYAPDSVVAGLLARTGNAPYHVCYEVDDLDAEIERLRDARYVVSSEPAPAPACGGARVAFLVHPYLGMVELLEKAG